MKDNVERYKRVPTTNDNLYLQQLCLKIARAMYSICYSHSHNHSHSDIATYSMYRNRKLEIAIRDRVFGADPLFWWHSPPPLSHFDTTRRHPQPRQPNIMTHRPTVLPPSSFTSAPPRRPIFDPIPSSVSMLFRFQRQGTARGIPLRLARSRPGNVTATRCPVAMVPSGRLFSFRIPPRPFAFIMTLTVTKLLFTKFHRQILPS